MDQTSKTLLIQNAQGWKKFGFLISDFELTKIFKCTFILYVVKALMLCLKLQFVHLIE